MRRVGFAITALVVAFLLAGHWCEGETLVIDNVDEPDAEMGGAEDRGGADVRMDVDVDDEVEATPGPATFVVRDREILAERFCDLDGDGFEDNSIADLGSVAAAVMAAVATSSLQAGFEDGVRSLFHFPWVDDLSVPADSDVVMILFEGVDVVDSAETGDDFSGEEPFFVHPGNVDGCGEPMHFLDEIAIEPDPAGGGCFEADVGMYSVPLLQGETDDGSRLLGFRGARFRALLRPGAREGDVTVCGYFLARDLGAVRVVADPASLTWLEGLVAGGAPHGQPAIPGLSPDIDLDGDGLETFELGEDFRVLRCIDGDSTPVDGPDCWQDARFADAFALVASVGLVPAVLAGLEPGWEHHPSNPGVCDVPPEESLWDTL